jgi:hypothetical protein
MDWRKFCGLGVMVMVLGCEVVGRRIPPGDESAALVPGACPSDPRVPLSAKPQSGEPCTFTGACGGTADSLCTFANWECQAGVLYAETSELIDCPLDPPIATTTKTWTDCRDAVANAHTTEPCNWGGACTQATEDPCCMVLAICGMNETHSATVNRYRFCAPGCTELVPDATGPVLTACPGTELAPGNSLPQMHLGQPCSGDFTCIGRYGFSSWVSAADYTAYDFGSGVEWCAGGVIVGTSANAFAIGPW